MSSAKDLDDRLDIAVDILAKNALDSTYPVDIRAAAEAFYRRLLISEKYTPQSKLMCDVTLIKAEETQAGSKSEDYGLGLVCDMCLDNKMCL